MLPNHQNQNKDSLTTPTNNNKPTISLSSAPRDDKEDKPFSSKRRESDGKVSKIKDDVVDVRCGTLYGKMHLKLFVCPGIHQPCIEVDGEMISPKQLTLRANKERQKDWKGSIRIGNKSLRVLIDMKALDFHEHATRCSSKCQSRNYVNFKFPENDPNFNLLAGINWSSGNPFSATSQPQNFPSMSGFGPQALLMPPSTNPMQSLLAAGQQTAVVSSGNPASTVTPKMSSPAGGSTGTGTAIVNALPQALCSESYLINLLHSEPLVFWTELQRVGLLREVVDDVTQQLNNVKNTAAGIQGLSNDGAVLLTRIVSALKYQSKLVSKIQAEQLNSLTGAATHMQPPVPPPISDLRGFSIAQLNVGSDNSMDTGVSRTSSEEDCHIDVVNLDPADQERDNHSALMRLLSCGDTTPRSSGNDVPSTSSHKSTVLISQGAPLNFEIPHTKLTGPESGEMETQY